MKSQRTWNRHLDQVRFSLSLSLLVLKGMDNPRSLTLRLRFFVDTNDLAMRFGLHSGPVTAGKPQGKVFRGYITGVLVLVLTFYSFLPVATSCRSFEGRCVIVIVLTS